MALDMAKYRKLFLEEAGEHLSEMGRALLELEKDAAASESIDVIFRMAHSIKSMAASLGYEATSELAHRLEDRMQAIRSLGRIENPGELGLLFKGLEGLERMVEAVSETHEPPVADEALLAELSAPLQAAAARAVAAVEEGSGAAESAEPKKKLPN